MAILSQWLNDLWQDGRYGLRALRANPGFTTVVAITLALGIGVNTAIFSLFNLFLQPLAVRDPASVVNLDWGGSEDRWLSFHEYWSLRNDAQSLSELVARADRTVVLGARVPGEAPTRVTAAFVSDNYLSALGAGLKLGRAFLPEENGLSTAHPVALISDAFWNRRFGRDASIVGQSLQLGGTTVTVLGVTAPAFVGLERTAPDVWLPLRLRGDVAPTEAAADLFGAPGRRWLLVSGRLAAGRTLETARADVALANGTLARHDREGASKAWLRLTPGSTLGARRNIVPVMGVVLASTLMVLLIACSNIANLMLTRGAARRRELGVRLSIGASRNRLIRQLLTESVLLAALGGVSGLLLAWWSVQTFLATALLSRMGVDASADLTRLNPDWRVLLFTLLLSVLAALTFGVVPAFRSTRGDLAGSVRTAGSGGADRSRTRLRSLLVIGEVAVCFVLLIAAGLLLRALTRLDAIQPGFDAAQVLVVQPRLDLASYDEARAEAFHRELTLRMQSVPGAQAITRVASVPLAGMPRRVIELEAESAGRHGQLLRAFRNSVAPNYFEALQIPILRGRGFTEEDVRAGGTVIVVSAATARRLWPNQEPLGQRLRPEPGVPFAEVIGVAQDVQVRLDESDPLMFYLPLDTWAGTSQLARMSGDLRAVHARVLLESLGIDPTVLIDATSVAEMVAASSAAASARAASALAAGLGLLALLLVGVGLYGVMSYSVAERRAEMAIRMALGATGIQVQALVIRQGLRLVLIGASLGILAGANIARLVSSLLFGLNPFDAVAYGAVLLFLLAVAFVASWLPARRATTIDPISLLRSN
jgi:predicted permease